MKEQVKYHPLAIHERTQCLENRDWTVTGWMRDQMDEAEDNRLVLDEEPFDPSLAALNAVVSETSLYRTNLGPRRGASTRLLRVTLPVVPKVPKYDAWIPVQTNYWAGKELHVEPYMPFLGDQDDACELAFEVYKDMAGDAGKELDLSDGEVGKNGELVLPKDDVERFEYYSMAQSRWREGSRKAILAVLDKFSRFDEAMWRVLATALGLKDIRRIKAIARVAQDRRRDKEGANSRRGKEKEMTQAVHEAFSNPKEEDMPVDEEWSASLNPLRLFCFTCHTIPCQQHAGMDVEPVTPIEDTASLRREKVLSQGKAKPCSKKCFLIRTQKVDEDDIWTAEEIILLREAVPIFGRDPCNISVVVGSRTCFEVSQKLTDPIEADIVNYEIQKARRVQRVEGTKRKEVAHSKNARVKVSAKTAVDKSNVSTATDQDFVPCHHNGPCNDENCGCVKKLMHCESTCGCNFGRYTQSGPCGGVVWTEPSEEFLRRKGTPRTFCTNRHFGCHCEDGHCDSGSCPCYEQNRACSADFCACDSTILPAHISINKRGCRNLPASIGKHKKTFVGKSDVHGFGLFAGEQFENGDLVGVYSGQLIDTRLADMIGRLYDATDRTYIFNVTESLVIDGGLLGSKAKFCNHTKPGDRENCASRLVRVRGDAYVALFTKRAVKAGEEFLFDYRFTGEVPMWAKDDGKGSRR